MLNPYKNNQEVFDVAYAGLKAQGFLKAEKVIGGGKRCVFRGINNTKCAVGHLVPDELVKDDDNFRTLESMINRNDYWQHLFYMIDIEFLKALQRCHDFTHSPEAMEIRLQDFAVEHGLKMPGEADSFIDTGI